MYSFLVLLAGILQSAMMSFNGLLAESVSLWGSASWSTLPAASC